MDDKVFMIPLTEPPDDEKDLSRGRNDDIRSPEESRRLLEFERRISVEIEREFGPVGLTETERSEIDETVEAFVLECAKANGTSEDDIKMYAADAWDEFREYLLRRLRPVFEGMSQRR